ncbi:cytochrome cypav [Echinococcus multilocularis]|uniref:Cytochrome monooxygenase cypa n=1 Tax=Echinococcus multilocularis TaxID=6211 RepID=A0A0S4MP10_ECHMU|nr:cytochrome cypav [Echinococcus multilocularis]
MFRPSIVSSFVFRESRDATLFFWAAWSPVRTSSGSESLFVGNAFSFDFIQDPGVTHAVPFVGRQQPPHDHLAIPLLLCWANSFKLYLFYYDGVTSQATRLPLTSISTP